MTAYVILTRDKTRDQRELDTYNTMAHGASAGHPAKLPVMHSRREVPEGPATEDVMLAFSRRLRRRRRGIKALPTGEA
jgi:hypothetical protein